MLIYNNIAPFLAKQGRGLGDGYMRKKRRGPGE